MAEREDAEVDLGRWVGRVLARWYIVALCVVAAILVSLVGGTTSKQTYRAKALIFLGLPFSTGNSPITSSPTSNPATPGLIVKQDAVLAKAAKEAGLKLEQLRGHVSTEVQSQAITKTSYTPFVNIVVQGPYAKLKVQRAANSLAQQVLSLTGGYADQRSDVLSAEVKRGETEIATLRNQEQATLDSIEQLETAEGLSPIERQLAVQNAQARLTSIGTRIGQVETSLTENRLALTQVDRIEKSYFVSRALASKVTATSRRAGFGVAVLLGLVLGTLLALASYRVWPAKTSAPPAAE